MKRFLRRNVPGFIGFLVIAVCVAAACLGSIVWAERTVNDTWTPAVIVDKQLIEIADNMLPDFRVVECTIEEKQSGELQTQLVPYNEETYLVSYLLGYNGWWSEEHEQFSHAPRTGGFNGALAGVIIFWAVIFIAATLWWIDIKDGW